MTLNRSVPRCMVGKRCGQSWAGTSPVRKGSRNLDHCRADLTLKDTSPDRLTRHTCNLVHTLCSHCRCCCTGQGGMAFGHPRCTCTLRGRIRRSRRRRRRVSHRGTRRNFGRHWSQPSSDREHTACSPHCRCAENGWSRRPHCASRMGKRCKGRDSMRRIGRRRCTFRQDRSNTGPPNYEAPGP